MVFLIKPLTLAALAACACMLALSALAAPTGMRISRRALSMETNSAAAAPSTPQSIRDSLLLSKSSTDSTRKYRRGLESSASAWPRVARRSVGATPQGDSHRSSIIRTTVNLPRSAVIRSPVTRRMGNSELGSSSQSGEREILHKRHNAYSSPILPRSRTSKPQYRPTTLTDAQLQEAFEGNNNSGSPTEEPKTNKKSFVARVGDRITKAKNSVVNTIRKARKSLSCMPGRTKSSESCANENV